MKTLAAPLALALAAVAAPAAAQQVPSGAAGAILFFNQSKASVGDRIVLTENAGAGLSTRSGTSAVQEKFNRDFDSQDDVRRTSGATVASGKPSRAQAIFANIAAQSAEDE